MNLYIVKEEEEIILKRKNYSFRRSDETYSENISKCKEFIEEENINFSSPIKVRIRYNRKNKDYDICSKKSLFNILDRIEKNMGDQLITNFFSISFWAYNRNEMNEGCYMKYNNTLEVEQSKCFWNCVEKTLFIPLTLPLKDISLESLVSEGSITSCYEVSVIKIKKTDNYTVKINMHVIEGNKFGSICIQSIKTNLDLENILPEFRPLVKEITELMKDK